MTFPCESKTAWIWLWPSKIATRSGLARIQCNPAKPWIALNVNNVLDPVLTFQVLLSPISVHGNHSIVKLKEKLRLW